MSKYPTTAQMNVTIQDLAWLAGQWQGHRDKDFIEEHWSRPQGGAMMGMFRWLKEEQVWFYELIIMARQGENFILHLKHFYPGLIGWEEKDQSVEFLLVRLAGHEAIFWQLNRPNPPWMIYRLEAENKLVSYFERDEEVKEIDKFVYMKRD